MKTITFQWSAGHPPNCILAWPELHNAQSSSVLRLPKEGFFSPFHLFIVFQETKYGFKWLDKGWTAQKIKMFFLLSGTHKSCDWCCAKRKKKNATPPHHFCLCLRLNGVYYRGQGTQDDDRLKCLLSNGCGILTLLWLWGYSTAPNHNESY